MFYLIMGQMVLQMYQQINLLNVNELITINNVINLCYYFQLIFILILKIYLTSFYLKFLNQYLLILMFK